MNFLKDLFKTPDCYDLMQRFFQSFEGTQKIPTLQHLYQEFPADTAMTLLIKIYGCLQSLQIFREIGDFSLTYQKELERCLNDLHLTLQYHVEDLKLKRPFTLLPPTRRYSWEIDSYFDVCLDKEQVDYGLALGLFILPMPYQIFKLFDLGAIPPLKQRMEQHQKKYAEIIANIYASLRMDRKNLNLLETYKTPLELLKAEKLLTSQAALTQYPAFNSWITEFILWGEETGQRQRLCDFLKQFKLNRLVVPSVQQIFVDKTTFLNSPKNKEAIARSPQTFKNLSPPLSQHKEEKSPFSFDGSFHHYLIKKTIDHLLLSYCPLENQRQLALAQAFEQQDLQRLDLVFFIHLLHSLFRPSLHESKPTLKEMVEWALPSSPPLKQIDKIGLIISRLFPEANEIHRFAYAFALLFMFDYFNQFQLSLKFKSLLFKWIYEEPRFSKAFLELYETTLFFHELFPFPNRVLTCLSDFSLSKNLDHLLFTSFWELLFTPFLPPLCLQALSTKALSLSPVAYGKTFFCLYYALRLHSREDPLPLLEPWQELLNLPQDPTMDALMAQNLSPQEIFFHSTQLLQTHQPAFEKSLFDFLHATLHFIHCSSYIDLNVETQEFLFQRILETSQSERGIAAQELLLLADALPKTSDSLKQRRLEKLHQAYCEKQKRDPIPLLAKLLDDWPANDEWVHFQLLFIRRLESFSSSHMSLVTVLVLLLCCPYPPFMRQQGEDISPDQTLLLDALENLDRLKVELDSKHQLSLFVDPRVIKKMDHSIWHLMDPRLYISSVYHGLGTILNIDMHIGTIMHVMTTAMLSTLGFGLDIFQQIQNLFENQKVKQINSHQQNVLNLAINPSKSFLGKWQGIVYMAEWTLQKHKNGSLYPHLHVVLWRSFHELESRHFNLPLCISIDQFTPHLWKLLKQLIGTLQQEVGINRQEELDKLQTLQQEFDFCLNFDLELKEAYDKFLEKQQDKRENDVLQLFSFIKELKIQIRMVQTALFPISQQRFTYLLSSQLGIVHTSEKFHLLLDCGPYNKFYELKHEDLKIPFQNLCQLVRECQTLHTIDHFCEIDTPQGTWRVSVAFDPLKTEQKIHVELQPPPDSEEVNFETISALIPSYQVTMTAHSFPKTKSYSLKLKNFIDHSNLEALLRWQLLMIKTSYSFN